MIRLRFNKPQNNISVAASLLAALNQGAIDGIIEPQTRRAIRAYERDHNTRAYGMVDRWLLATPGLG